MPFQLDRPNAETTTFIFFVLQCADGRLKYPVKEKVHPSKWSNYRTKDKVINSILNRIESHVNELQARHKLQNIPLTKDAARDSIDVLLHRKAVLSGFFPVIEDIILNREAGLVLTKEGKRFSAYTIRNYRNTLSVLREFDPRLTFHTIDARMYDRLISFSNAKGHSVNMIGQTVKNLRVFMRQALKDGYHSNVQFEAFKMPAEQTVDIYLTDEEVDRICRHPFSDPKLDRARDWFIIDCYTGLRVSDLQAVYDDNLAGGTLRLMNEKTDTLVVVPLNSKVKAILAKWGGLPTKISDQKLNKYLKIVAFQAGIEGTILHSITKSGRRVDTVINRWEMVSNHTARRSFITNLLKAGVPQIEVMKLAGLKKLATLQKYYKESEAEIAERLKGHSFFQ